MTPDFFQSAPQLQNTFQSDHLLKRYLDIFMPAEFRGDTFQVLEELGALASGRMLELALAAETSPPRHVPFDPWGKRIDQIITHPAWGELEKIAAQMGLIATGYERKQGEFSRLKQMSMLYLYHPSSAFFSCPLAMTDGAARAIEIYGDDHLKQTAFRHLISRDPKTFWTSGQWMTEKIGGSDMAPSEATAVKKKDHYALSGTKWFTSATTSPMAMALARIQQADGSYPEGSRGLSLFYIELKDANQQFQNIEVLRLKDKLGTKALPTAELVMHGTRARLVGEAGNGVKKIATLFNLTRIYNSICALAHMRRGLDLALDYSRRRRAFDKNIIAHPLQQKTLNQMVLDYCGSFHLVMFAVRLLGLDETGKATAQEKALLRLLTPLIKLSTGKKVLTVTSEVLETFGGAGYVEDTGIPRLFRDSQVFSIWEGTTNVLCLDAIRAIEKEDALSALLEDLQKRSPNVKARLDHPLQLLLGAAKTLASEKNPLRIESLARDLAFFMADLTTAFLLGEFAEQSSHAGDQEMAAQWITQRLSVSSATLVHSLDNRSPVPHLYASI